MAAGRVSVVVLSDAKDLRFTGFRACLLGALVAAVSCVGQSSRAPYINPHGADSIGTVRAMYNGALSPALAVTTFRNIDRLFPTRTVEHGPTPYPLPLATTRLSDVRFTSKAASYTLDSYMAANRV